MGNSILDIWSLEDLLLMQLIYGLFLYIAGGALVWYVFRKKALGQILLIIVSQLLLAYALSVVIWIVWPFPFVSEMQFRFLHLPALAAECITLPMYIFPTMTEQFKKCWHFIQYWGEKKE